MTKNKICIVAMTSFACAIWVINCVVLGYYCSFLSDKAFSYKLFALSGIFTIITLFLISATTSAFRENVGNLLFILVLIFGMLGFFIGVSL